MNKKFLSFLLLAVGLVMSSTAWALTGSGTSTDPYLVTSASEMTEAIGNGGYIKLNGSATDMDFGQVSQASDKIYFNVTKEVSIDLNGHNLKVNAEYGSIGGHDDAKVFNVTSTGKLTLTGSGTYATYASNNNCGWNFYSNGGTITIDPGEGNTMYIIKSYELYEGSSANFKLKGGYFGDDTSNGYPPYDGNIPSIDNNWYDSNIYAVRKSSANSKNWYEVYEMPYICTVSDGTNDVPYRSIAAAMTAAKVNGTITYPIVLTANATYSSDITEDYTFNGAEFSLTPANSYRYLKAGTYSCKVKAYDITGGTFNNEVSADYAEGGTFTSTSNATISDIYAGTFNGAVTASSIYAGTFNGAVTADEIDGGNYNASVTCSNIIGGIHANQPSVPSDYSVLSNNGKYYVAATANISNGLIVSGTYYDNISPVLASTSMMFGDEPIYLVVPKSNLNADNKIITGIYYNDLIRYYLADGYSYGVVQANGSSTTEYIVGQNVSADNNKLIGGTFTVNPTNYVDATDYDVTENPTGVWTVALKDGLAQAQVGNIQYKSFWTALNAINDGTVSGELKMLAPITLTSDNLMGKTQTGSINGTPVYNTYAIKLSKDVTIDLNGYTLQLPDADYGVYLDYYTKMYAQFYPQYYSYGTLTIKDGSDAKTGKFLFGTCRYDNVSDDAELITMGGTFNMDMTDYCPNGYVSKPVSGESGMYKVMLDPVCKIGDTNYSTLAAAVKAFKTNDIIVMLKDNDESLTLPAGIKIQISTDATCTGTLTVATNCVLETSATEISVRLRTATDADALASAVVDGVTYYYAKLQDAIDVTAANGTVNLLKADAEAITLPLGMKIKLNGYAYTGTCTLDEGYVLSNNENSSDEAYARLPKAGDEGVVASIGSNYYLKLTAAVAAVKANETIELLVNNNTEAIKLPYTTGVKIHLNGNTTHGDWTTSPACTLVDNENDYSYAQRRSSTGAVASMTDNGDILYYLTFDGALEDANATTDATITLLDNCSYATNGTGLWNITSSMTIDGASKTLSGYGALGSSKAATTLAINEGGESSIEVTLKDLTINNTCTGTGRAIDVRANVSQLDITNCQINTVGSGNNQGISIVGNDANKKCIVNITNSTVQNMYNSHSNGYAIITYAPVTMSIDNSTIKGWAALYFKGSDTNNAGSKGSVVDIKNGSVLEGYNAQNGGQNYFGTIVCEDGGITVNAGVCTIKAEAPSTNVTNSVICNSSYNSSTTNNTFNFNADSKVNLSTTMRYFVIDDAGSYCNAVVNLNANSKYNFIPTDQYVYNTNEYYTSTYNAQTGVWEAVTVHKSTHIVCQSGMGVISNEDEETMAAYPYTIGAVSGDPNPYNIVAYKGDEEKHDMDHVEAPSWEAQVAAKPNTVGIISGETYDAVTATAFAKSTNNIVVKYPVGDDDYAYVAPTFNVTDLTADGIGTDYDKTDYYSPEDFTATKGGYSRALKAGCNSACVPFDVKVDNVHFYNHELLTFSTFDKDANTVYFEYVNEVSAGTPFIILLSEARTWSVAFASTKMKGKPISEDAKAGVFMTTDKYGKLQKGEDDAYYSITPSGYFGKLTNNLYPFRACFQLEGATPGNYQTTAPRLGIITESNTVTYVDEVLSNHVVSEKYIENGKLVIYHNGKFYNANGMLVK